MLKSEIKNGAVVETRNGDHYLKVDNTLLSIDKLDGNFMDMERYEEDLTRPIHEYDIVKVINPRENKAYGGVCNLALCDFANNQWSWERKESRVEKLKRLGYGSIGNGIYVKGVPGSFDVNAVVDEEQDDVRFFVGACYMYFESDIEKIKKAFEIMKQDQKEVN